MIVRDVAALGRQSGNMLRVSSAELDRIVSVRVAEVATDDLLAVTIKLRTALDALRPFPLVVEPVAAALIAEADAAIAKAEPPTP